MSHLILPHPVHQKRATGKESISYTTLSSFCTSLVELLEENSYAKALGIVKSLETPKPREQSILPPRKVHPGHTASTDVHVPVVAGSHGERDWDEPLFLFLHMNFCHSLTNSMLNCFRPHTCLSIASACCMGSKGTLSEHGLVLYQPISSSLSRRNLSCISVVSDPLGKEEVGGGHIPFSESHPGEGGPGTVGEGAEGAHFASAPARSTADSAFNLASQSHWSALSETHHLPPHLAITAAQTAPRCPAMLAADLPSHSIP